jgi:hypothetical protein
LREGKPKRLSWVAYNALEEEDDEISLIRLIKIFATVLMLWRTDLIHWGFLDAF